MKTVYLVTKILIYFFLLTFSKKTQENPIQKIQDIKKTKNL